MLPLQVPIPGGIEMLIILFIAGIQLLPALIVVYLIYRDAAERDSNHVLAWTLGAFFGGPVVWILYFFVRDQVGSAGASASGV